MDNALQLFESILNKKQTGIEQLISENAIENQFIDFKAKTDPDGNKRMSNDDTKNLAKALSGFSNAGGGVLIWGVGENEQKELIPSYISNVSKFIESLNSQTPNAAMPLVKGVEHKVVFQDDKGTGVAISYIPQSDRGPHISLAKGARNIFYTRSCDGFHSLDYNTIANMFGRAPHADLEVKIYPLDSSENKDQGYVDVRIKIILENKGRGAAEYFGLDLEIPALFRENIIDDWHHESLKTNDASKLSIKFRNGWTRRSSNPLFHNEELDITSNDVFHSPLVLRVKRDTLMNMQDMIFNATLYSNNMQTKNQSFKLIDFIGS